MVLKYPFQDRIGGEIMIELAYSFHIGNDKNKTKKANQKNTPTNYNNNAIQNAMQLSKVNHHNLRQYDNSPENIKTLYGSNDIVKDVKEDNGPLLENEDDVFKLIPAECDGNVVYSKEPILVEAKPVPYYEDEENSEDKISS